jgi:hypothetical protein
MLTSATALTVVVLLAQWPGLTGSSVVQLLPGTGALPPSNGSPPPPTDALFTTFALGPLPPGTAAAVTFTGKVIPLVPLAARFGVPVHVTAWPANVQLHTPLVNVPVQFAVIPPGNVSATVTTPAVAAVPAFVTVSVYVAPVWFTVHGPFDAFVTCNCGVLTAVVIVLVQLPVTGHVGSPPPCTVAVLLTLGAALAVGVTGITKLTAWFGPAAAVTTDDTVHVTCWPTAVQPLGSVPSVNDAGTTSVIVIVDPSVSAVPVSVTVSV